MPQANRHGLFDRGFFLTAGAIFMGALNGASDKLTADFKPKYSGGEIEYPPCFVKAAYAE